MRKRSVEKAYWRVMQSTAGLTGPEFYLPLATSLAKALHVDHVILTARVGAAAPQLRSLAFVRFKQPAENIEYDCQGTPCEQVIAGREVVHTNHLRKKFPASREIESLKADSFAGVPLKDLSKNILGHLAVFDRGPLPEAKEILPVLRVFATRAAAEVERQRSDSVLKRLLASMHDVFWIFSRDFKRAFYVSPGIQRVRDITPEALYRTPSLWTSTMLPRDQARFEALIQRRLPAGPVNFIYRIRLQNGEIRTIRDRLFPYEDPESGQPLYYGVAEDATKRLAEAGELERSRKFSALGQMAGSITHDFKTVLTVVRCAIGLLEEVPTYDSRSREITRMLSTACDQGMALTSQLLSFTRHKEGPLTEQDLNSVIRQTSELLVRLMKTEIQVDLKLEEYPPLILGDHCQIEQLLTNLILNARDAMPSGGKITIRTHRSAFPEHPPRPAMLLAVSDTGIGMDPETLRNAGGAFFTTKEEGSGSGLGLTTVRNIVARHKGEFRMESSQNQGTQISILFPLARAAAHSA
ncbi:MAG: hypothetical protein CO113_16130 [Elusimicrobia bacterium CG_4_9_14_3_um_filter_62_55]|nr:MAG: hypothetical protein COR54_06295 [Elusimicrobia bacterium CG22_combo_CG10-13_8_21_14_all_63_91]PJA12728.1 MAG: hypothetical protein COX66_16810 [Elusimicrobia bacterium CG_4_10_14_0_2_um_filter_63_34]PJB24027.1 MAG: hypothetical protein CO113_16130 [Elusimicrobia bacterium CG_4_9_14_3_um_filter_62_55]